MALSGDRDVVLAEAEDATLPEDFAEIGPRSDPGVAPLSLGQEGLWLFQQLYPDNTALSILRTLAGRQAPCSERA